VVLLRSCLCITASDGDVDVDVGNGWDGSDNLGVRGMERLIWSSMRVVVAVVVVVVEGLLLGIVVVLLFVLEEIWGSRRRP